jgi:hypothetical protein
MEKIALQAMIRMLQYVLPRGVQNPLVQAVKFYEESCTYAGAPRPQGYAKMRPREWKRGYRWDPQ